MVCFGGGVREGVAPIQETKAKTAPNIRDFVFIGSKTCGTNE